MASLQFSSLDDAPFGAAFLDKDMRFVWVNRALAEIVGRAAEELLGRPMSQETPELKALEASLASARDHGISRVLDISLRATYRPGTARNWLVLLFPVSDDEGAAASGVILAEVADRRQAIEAMRNERAFLRKIIDAAPLVILVNNRAGRIVLANATFARNWQRKPEELIGHRLSDLLPGDQQWERTTRQDLDAMNSKETIRIPEESFTKRDGGLLWLSTTLVPLVDENGACNQVLVVASDVTERKILEESLRETDRRKNEFLGALAHELRNPLAPMRAAHYVLSRAPPGSEQAARANEVIGRQIEHLARLVDDLLDVTRIARGKVKVQRAPMDLLAVVRGAVEDYAPLFVNRRIELTSEGLAGCLSMNGDATRLAQVMGNLLQNAVKFTDEGGHVRVSFEQRGQEAILRVRDDGVGIATGMRKRLFEPFVQADRTLARSQGGLGLGLALVKGIVELHGGTVAVESDGEGKGAEFVTSLPVTKAKAEAIASTKTKIEARGEGRKILVIEDNADAAETLRDVLEIEGHEVHVAVDGLTGLAEVARMNPDVVVCDIGLPGIDGYEVARRLRSTTQGRPLMIALTGYASTEDVKAARVAGFEYHLAKPADLNKLSQIIARAPTITMAAGAAKTKESP